MYVELNMPLRVLVPQMVSISFTLIGGYAKSVVKERLLL